MNLGEMSFQKLVVIIASIILIFILIFVGYMIYNANKTMKWPPEVAECPDYWKIGLNSGGNKVCIPNGDLNKGSFNGTDMNFNVPTYLGKIGTKEKYKWARDNGITWDGITNNPDVINM